MGIDARSIQQNEAWQIAVTLSERLERVCKLVVAPRQRALHHQRANTT
jgi:hypothetical protein